MLEGAGFVLVPNEGVEYCTASGISGDGALRRQSRYRCDYRTVENRSQFVEMHISIK